MKTRRGMFEKLKRGRVANQDSRGYSRTVFFTGLLLIVVAAIAIILVRSLQNGEAPSTKLDNRIADRAAEYPGEPALFDYVGTTAIGCLENLGSKGKVRVRFLTEHGEMDKAQVVRGLNDVGNDEAIRLIKSMPEWTPAVREEHPVKTQMLVVPVMYKVG